MTLQRWVLAGKAFSDAKAMAWQTVVLLIGCHFTTYHLPETSGFTRLFYQWYRAFCFNLPSGSLVAWNTQDLFRWFTYWKQLMFNFLLSFPNNPWRLPQPPILGEPFQSFPMSPVLLLKAPVKKGVLNCSKSKSVNWQHLVPSDVFQYLVSVHQHMKQHWYGSQLSTWKMVVNH